MTIARKSDLSIFSKRLNQTAEWLRPADWVEMPDLESNPYTAFLVVAVYDTDSEYVCLRGDASTGTVTIDWGDGTSTTHNSTTVAEKKYTYSSLTSAVTSAGYKTALIKVTATTGNLTSINLFVLGTTLQQSQLTTKFLDIGLNTPGTAVSTIGGGGITSPLMQRFRTTIDTRIAASNAFSGATSLQYISEIDINGSTTATSMFQGCTSLVTSPIIKNASGVTTFGSMFLGCTSLKYVNLFTLPSATALYNNMFQDCTSLEYLPPLIFRPSTSLQMFQNCFKLNTIDATFNFNSTTSISFMFDGCYTLKKLPDSLSTLTTALTDISSAFRGCYSIESVPLFNTINVTTLSATFQNCFSLKSLPAFNFGKVVNMSNTFNTCKSLSVINNITFNTSTNTTTFSNTFNNCLSLSILEMTWAGTGATTYTTPFTISSGTMRKFRVNNLNQTFSIANNNFSATELNTIYTNLATVTAKTITVIGNYGVAADDPTIATAKGWTVSG